MLPPRDEEKVTGWRGKTVVGNRSKGTLNPIEFVGCILAHHIPTVLQRMHDVVKCPFQRPSPSTAPLTPCVAPAVRVFAWVCSLLGFSRLLLPHIGARA